MKSTGIVRRIDDLGRVVIPKELRRTLQVETGDSLEIFTHEKSIILRKYQPGCFICGSLDGLQTFYDKQLCNKCIGEAARLQQNGRAPYARS